MHAGISTAKVVRLGFPRCPICDQEPRVEADVGIWFAECQDHATAARSYNSLKTKWNTWIKKYPLES